MIIGLNSQIVSQFKAWLYGYSVSLLIFITGKKKTSLFLPFLITLPLTGQQNFDIFNMTEIQTIAICHFNEQ